MLLAQKDSMKEHPPIFLMVTNYTDEDVQWFFLCFQRNCPSGSKAVVTFIAGSWDTME